MTERSESVPLAEREQALVDSYIAKVDDLARETLRTSAALLATKDQGPVGMEGIGWDMAMEHVRRAIEEATDVAAERVVDTEHGERSSCCDMTVDADLLGDGVDRCSGCRYPLRLTATISEARTYDRSGRQDDHDREDVERLERHIGRKQIESWATRRRSR